MRRETFCLGLMTAVAIVVSGCATSGPRYQPPREGDMSASVISMSEKWMGIVSIDGAKSMSGAQYAIPGLYPDKYVVSSGKHELFAVIGNEKPCALSIVVEPGREYLLRKEVDYGKYRLWCEDRDDGRWVGGFTGTEVRDSTTGGLDAATAPKAGPATSGVARIYIIAVPGDKSHTRGTIYDNKEIKGKISTPLLTNEGKFIFWERAAGRASITAGASEHVDLTVRGGEVYYIYFKEGHLCALSAERGKEYLKTYELYQ